jgi:hypothetical protein
MISVRGSCGNIIIHRRRAVSGENGVVLNRLDLTGECFRRFILYPEQAKAKIPLRQVINNFFCNINSISNFPTHLSDMAET